nr:DNA methyltransferase [Amycolatopsis anabasis]
MISGGNTSRTRLSPGWYIGGKHHGCLVGRQHIETAVAADRVRTGHRAVGTVEIARRCVRLGCSRGGVVLDPFSGSGTTGLAAREHGCSFIGIDLDPACHEQALRRLGEARLS